MTTATRSLSLLLLPSAISLAAQPSWQAPPKLVVGIVVDQMRADFIYRYWDNFGEGGFKRLVGEGAFLRNAHFPYMPTVTGPGHASVYTGTSPSHHGITGNELVDRASGHVRYCAEDAEASVVGASGGAARSPLNLLATTIADELERRTGGRSRTVGLSIKDRGAILPIGRTGDAAFWFAGGADGAFVTSRWYADSLPGWMAAFNARRLAASYLKGTWDLLLPRERYHQALPDDNPYEIPLSGAASATLPQDLAALSGNGANTGLIGYVPAGNTLLTDAALAAMDGEELGRDAIPDLLAVSYSSPDLLGHRMGPRALEIEDMYLRLDRELARLLKALDERVGAGRYTVFLTADHGVVDVPAYLRELKGSAGYVPTARLEAAIERSIAARHGDGDWVRRMMNDQVWLNDSLLAARKADPAAMRRLAAEALLADTLVAEALTADDLVRLAYPDGVRAMIQRGFMPARSGDVCYALRPGYFEREDWSDGRGTTHGSPWTYDTHVPILFFGQGIRPGEVVRRTSITDIAPTVAVLLGTAFPDACSGQPVPEVLAP
ncbi:MAG: alkaline phosphatase family protein [Flavobacteriales bacterium]|nr:alkaline phosphatase family protein [Flavobacteriales bacterium]MBK8949017.1 alkaline phosphatase family protein [Flavobacteriales bacterium]